MSIDLGNMTGDDLANLLFNLAEVVRGSRRENALEVAHAISDAGFEALHLDDVCAAEQAEADERDRAERRYEERRDAL